MQECPEVFHIMQMLPIGENGGFMQFNKFQKTMANADEMKEEMRVDHMTALNGDQAKNAELTGSHSLFGKIDVCCTGSLCCCCCACHKGQIESKHFEGLERARKALEPNY